MSAIEAVLLDLDGTLLPLDTDAFIASYMEDLVAHAVGWGMPIDGKALSDAIFRACLAEIENTDSTLRNSEVFWCAFEGLTGLSARAYENHFDRYYGEPFASLGKAYAAEPICRDLIALLRQKRKRLVLATNPLFPRNAIEARLCWAGLDPNDFEWITDFDNAHFTKPHRAYYAEILDVLGLPAESCVMVGNDGGEDIAPAKSLGMGTFFVEEYPLREGLVHDACPRGGYADLLRWAGQL